MDVDQRSISSEVGISNRHSVAAERVLHLVIKINLTSENFS